MWKLLYFIGIAFVILAVAITMPNKTQAGEFANYCAPLADGEVLDSELTPQNMGYIFDENQKIIKARADQLEQYYRDGITEECGAGDIGAYVEQLGTRVLLVVYPPGQYPLGIAPETMQQIQVNYAACVAEELAFVDKNNNGKIDESENANLYRTGEVFCNEELQAEMRHAGEIAALNAEQALAETQIADAHAAMEARTRAIIQGAREEIGLN